MAQALTVSSGSDRPMTWTSSGSKRNTKPPAWLRLAALLDAIWIFNLLTLLRYPGPSAAEAGVVQRALRFARGAQLPQPDATDPGLARLWTDQAVFAPWLQSLAVSWLGLSLYSMRVVSLACGIALLVAVYALARQLHAGRAALLATFLTAFSTGFLTATHLAVSDAMVAAFGFGGIALAALDRKSTRRLTACLAGLAVAGAIAVDPMGISLLPPALLVVGFAPARLTRRAGLTWFLSGLIVGVGGLLVLPLLGWVNTASGPPLGSLAVSVPTGANPSAWPGAIVANLAALAAANDARVPLVIAALASIALGRGTNDRQPLKLTVWLFGTVLVGTAVLDPVGSPAGAILVAPLANLLVACLLVWLMDGAGWSSRWRRGGEGVRPALAACAWLLAIGSIAWNLGPLRANAMADFETTADWVQQVVPSGDVVVGDGALWFALPNRTLVSWQDLEVADRDAPATILAGALRSRRPDYVIVGLTAPSRASSGVAASGASEAAPNGTVDSVLARYGHQVGEIRAGSLGDVRAYRLSWP